MTKFLKSSELTSNWFEIDAKNAVVGRLASIIAMIVRGKNKTTYTPHMDDGDFVVVKNVELAKFTGNKFKDKTHDADIIKAQDRIEKILGLKVNIVNKKNNSGKVTIEYKNLDQFELISGLLTKN